MKPKRYAAIILAAGFSSRMHDFKPLLPLGGRSAADRLIDTFTANGLEVILVAGHRQEELRAGIESRNIRIAVNPDYRLGMFTSVQAGLRAAGDDCDGAFIAPVDIPLIRPYTIRRLLEASAVNPGKVLYPTFKKTRGHPPLVPARIFSRILESAREHNLKAALQDSEGTVVEVPVADGYIHFDIDIPADYEAMKEGWERYGIPDEDECEAVAHDICRVVEPVYKHMQKVCEAAGAVSRALVERGIILDTEAVSAASLLHDIAKGQPEHDAAGARLLREMGFERVAELVEMHTELTGDSRQIDLETKIVFLADKLVMQTEIVPLERRYQASLKKFGGDPESRENILQRRDRAVAVQKEIEELLGRPLTDILTLT